MTVTADDLRDLQVPDDEYGSTDDLKAAFRKLRGERRPFFLTAEDLDGVFRWKLRTQYGRQAQLRARNSDAVYRAVTEAAFKVCAPDCTRPMNASALGAWQGAGGPATA